QGKALDMLLESNIAAFGAMGTALEVELLLRTGRPEAVRDWTGPEHQAALGLSPYYWQKIQALAACGDYESARDTCGTWAQSLAIRPGAQKAVDFREMMSEMIGEQVLSEYG